MKILLLCSLYAALVATGFAQSDSTSGSKGKDEVRTITGCLTQGDNAKEYLLKAADGSTWELHDNSTVNLASYVDKQVSITGAVSNAKMHNLKEDAKDAAADTGVKKDNAEHGHLKPTEVQKVSDTCQK